MHAFSQNHHQFFALFSFHFLVSRLEFVDSTKVANKFSLPFSVVVAVALVVGNEKREGYLDCSGVAVAVVVLKSIKVREDGI